MDKKLEIRIKIAVILFALVALIILYYFNSMLPLAKETSSEFPALLMIMVLIVLGTSAIGYIYLDKIEKSKKKNKLKKVDGFLKIK